MHELIGYALALGPAHLRSEGDEFPRHIARPVRAHHRRDGTRPAGDGGDCAGAGGFA